MASFVKYYFSNYRSDNEGASSSKRPRTEDEGEESMIRGNRLMEAIEMTTAGTTLKVT